MRRHRIWSRPDTKIDRICDSWLTPDRRTATHLAQVADLVDVPAGTLLEPGRFAYVGLDRDHIGLVVSDGTPPITVTSDAAVLVLTDDAFHDVRRHIPALHGAVAVRRESVDSCAIARRPLPRPHTRSPTTATTTPATTTPATTTPMENIMNTHPTNDAQHVTRRPRRRGLLALALAASAAAGIAAGDSLVAAEATSAVQPRTSITAAARDCGQLWDRILVLGLPEEARASVAEWMGFAQTGAWLSADGLDWENIDGRIVSVASPQPDGTASSCGPGADVDTTAASERSANWTSSPAGRG